MRKKALYSYHFYMIFIYISHRFIVVQQTFIFESYHFQPIQ